MKKIEAKKPHIHLFINKATLVDLIYSENSVLYY